MVYPCFDTNKLFHHASVVMIHTNGPHLKSVKTNLNGNIFINIFILIPGYISQLYTNVDISANIAILEIRQCYLMLNGMLKLFLSLNFLLTCCQIVWRISRFSLSEFWTRLVWMTWLSRVSDWKHEYRPGLVCSLDFHGAFRSVFCSCSLCKTVC